jgi:hypothetical protein
VGAQVRIQTPVAVVLVRDDHLTALDTQQELHRVPDPTGKGKPQSATRWKPALGAFCHHLRRPHPTR